MKKILFLSFFIALFSCSDNSPEENFTGEHVNKIMFTIEGESLTLSFGSADHNGRLYVYNKDGSIDSVQNVAGINLFRESKGKVDFYHEFDIRSRKTLSLVNPEAEFTFDPANKYTYELLKLMFVDHRPLRNIPDLDAIVNRGKDGLYAWYNRPTQVEGVYEKFELLPSVEINGQINYSSFLITEAKENPKKPQGYAGDLVLKTTGTFDFYMRSETSGEIIHLENGEFLFYFAPYL